MNDNEYWKWEEAQTRGLVKSLPSNFKQFTLQQVRDYLQLLSSEDKVAWAHFIGKNPILRRVIYYVFSPAEEIGLRLKMLAKNDIDVDFDMKYICFVQTLPEINQHESLRIYLRNLSEKFLRVMTVDIQKKTGVVGSFEELRQNCLRIEKTDHGRKTIMDHSPWTKYELIKTPGKKIMTIYALDESDMASRFNVDPFLIGWIQAFDNPDIRDEAYTDRLEIRIVDTCGNLVKPPKKYFNPFFFSLRERYAPLLKQAFKIFQSPGIIEYEDIEYCFFMVLKESPGYINPKSLYWKIRDLVKQRNKTQKKVLEEEPIDDDDTNIKEQVGDLGIRKPVQQNFDKDNTNFPEEESLDDEYEPSSQRRLEDTSTSDPLQILLDSEIIDTAKRNGRFWNLITSDKPKTETERQHIHRFREKLKKF